MTIHLPEDLARSIQTEVFNRHFGSENDLVAAAVQEYLRRKHEGTRQADDTVAAGHAADTEEEPNTQELQRRLLEAGVLSEISRRSLTWRLTTIARLSRFRENLSQKLSSTIGVEVAV